MLLALGLDDSQTRLYHHLLDVATASETDLAARLGLTQSEVVVGIAALERLGLVSRPSLHPELVTATAPDLGIGSLLAERRAVLAEVERVIPQLSSRFEAVAAGRQDAEVIAAVQGVEALERRIDQLRRGAHRELLVIAAPDSAGQPDPALTSGPMSGAPPVETRGVKQRVVIPRSWLDLFGPPVAALGPGQPPVTGRPREVVRVVERVPMRLMIADHDVALVPIGDGTGAGAAALLIRPSTLLDGLVALFELLWGHGFPLETGPTESSAPASPESGPPMDEVDRKVLGLLLAGLTDQAIGRQLGLSLRTVQRHTRALMDLAGVATRMQLGYEVARRGWV